MPYITKEERDFLLSGLMESDNAGQLNYSITKVIKQLMIDRGLSYNKAINPVLTLLKKAEKREITVDSNIYAIQIHHLISAYISKNKDDEWIGALDGARFEFYRRVAAPHEDQKCRENGDVY